MKLSLGVLKIGLKKGGRGGRGMKGKVGRRVKQKTMQNNLRAGVQDVLSRLSINVDGELLDGDVNALFEAIGRYETELGMSRAVAIRRGTIALLKSLRARTAKAPKQAPSKDVAKYSGPGPHYITPKGHGKESQHRWSVKRRGGKDARTYVVPAKSKADARKKSGQYTQWGLARKSWGHAMAMLFGRTDASGNPRAKLKSGLVEASMKEVATGGNERVEVEIVNKLEYIREATPDNVVAESMRAATRLIEGQIEHGLEKAAQAYEQ